MAFGIGINNENQDAGMIRGSQQDIACECWFTQKGKIIPLMIKVQDEDGEINYRQRYLSYSYYIYRVDYHNAQPFTRIAEYSISGYEDVTILSYGEDTYCFSAAAILPVCVSL